MYVFGFEIALLWLLIIATLALAYIYGTWTYSYFKKQGINGPTPWPMVGSFYTLIKGKGFQDTLLRFQIQYGKLYGLYLARTPILVTSDLDLLKEILVKRFADFPNRKKSPVKVKPLSDGLTSLEGDHWKHARNVLSPAFTGSKMRQMAGMLNKCADTMVTILEKAVEDGKDVEFKKVFGGFSMDCIASAAFGLQVDSQNNPDDQFVKYAKSILNFNIYNPLLLIILVFPSTSKFLERVFGYQIISKETVAFFVDVIEKAMEFRHGDGEDQETKRVDFLQLMLNAHKDNDSEITDDEKLDENHDFDFYKEHGLSKDEILGHSFLFFLAGYDTVSSCLSFTSYLLATNVEVQDRLVDEINDTLQDCHQLSFEVISKMNYLDMVLCESLRLYPPAVVTDRRCCRDTEIGGVFLKKDMRIIVPIWVIHHDPELWPEPDRFLPERFTKEEKEKRHPLAWMPFGIGPRNCIGMRFALMEAKIALIKVLQKFRLEPCSKTEIPPKLKKGGLLDAQNGFWLRMTKRM